MVAECSLKWRRILAHEVLALLWALGHWSYLIAMSPVVLRSVHSLANYVISGKTRDAGVSTPCLTSWTIALFNKDIIWENIPNQPISPYALVITGSEHEYLMSEVNQEPLESIFKEGPKLSEQVFQKTDTIWFIDGSCFYVKIICLLTISKTIEYPFMNLLTEPQLSLNSRSMIATNYGI